jgi:hypothetical protein
MWKKNWTSFLAISRHSEEINTEINQNDQSLEHPTREYFDRDIQWCKSNIRFIQDRQACKTKFLIISPPLPQHHQKKQQQKYKQQQQQ